MFLWSYFRNKTVCIYTFHKDLNWSLCCSSCLWMNFILLVVNTYELCLQMTIKSTITIVNIVGKRVYQKYIISKCIIISYSDNKKYISSNCTIKNNYLKIFNLYWLRVVSDSKLSHWSCKKGPRHFEHMSLMLEPQKFYQYRCVEYII